MEKQFVDGGDTSVALRWDSPLPRPLQVTGYNVYLNGTHKMFVSGSDERTALVSGVPMTQVRVCVGVCMPACLRAMCTCHVCVHVRVCVCV